MPPVHGGMGGVGRSAARVDCPSAKPTKVTIFFRSPAFCSQALFLSSLSDPLPGLLSLACPHLPPELDGCLARDWWRRCSPSVHSAKLLLSTLVTTWLVLPLPSYPSKTKEHTGKQKVFPPLNMLISAAWARDRKLELGGTCGSASYRNHSSGPTPHYWNSPKQRRQPSSAAAENHSKS